MRLDHVLQGVDGQDQIMVVLRGGAPLKRAFQRDIFTTEEEAQRAARRYEIALKGIIYDPLSPAPIEYPDLLQAVEYVKRHP